MSGGSFDYAFSHVDRFADELEVKLDPAYRDGYGEPLDFEPATVAKLREILALATCTAKLIREAEWLFSGDTGDESFMRRVLEIEVPDTHKD